MNCEQFQETLPFIIDGGGNEEEDGHLRTCPHCAELAQELRTIATESRLLPMHEPGPRVWAGIERSLYQEGLIQEARKSPNRPVTALHAPIKSWTPFGWAVAMTAVAAFTLLMVNYRPRLPESQNSAKNVIVARPPALQAQAQVEDQQLMSQVSQQAPDVRQAYEVSLREVNTYISDAQQAVDQDPQDAFARGHLVDAYQQKQMLYEMATARTLP